MIEREEQGHPQASIRTYVLRAGRMTDAQRRAIADHGGELIIPFSGSIMELDRVFPEPKPVIMEIGFGMGAATWRIAQSRPEYNYLCSEVHAPGVGKLIMDTLGHDIHNLKIIQHDAIEVLRGMIPENSLAGIHIFYPDPWPKKRHHKRRLMRPALVNLMISRIAPGGYLYFVTDIEEYGAETLTVLSSCEGIGNRYEGFAPRIEWRPETKFEAKAKKASREAWELYFEKR